MNETDVPIVIISFCESTCLQELILHEHIINVGVCLLSAVLCVTKFAFMQNMGYLLQLGNNLNIY